MQFSKKECFGSVCAEKY